MKYLYKNVGVLFFAQLFSYVVPILEIPILARALGVQEYGKVVFLQSAALLSSLIVEYGFSLSGSRQVAIFREDALKLAKIYEEVISAKALISLIIILFGLVLFGGLGGGAYDGFLVGLAGVYFLAFGFSPFWFFQGLERITLVLVVEVSLRFVCLLLLYIFVRGEDDALIALSIMSSTALLNTLFGNFLCFFTLGRIGFSWRGAVSQVASGFHFFIYKSSNNILLSAGPSLVGFTLGSAAVASYVPAEKVIRGFTSFMSPVLIGLYPYLNRQFLSAQESAKKLSWMVVFFMFVLGMIAATTLYLIGDLLVSSVLGAEFSVASDVLKTFVWIIPFRLMTQALGLCVLIPMGRDKDVSFWMMIFSAFSMLSAGILSYWFNVVGVVLGFVFSEILLCVVLMFVSIKRSSENSVGGKS